MKVVGSVDTASWIWIVVAVVVIVAILLLLLGGRRRKAMQQKRDQEHREKAAEIRREAENKEIDAREREAKAARARADAEQAQVNAARLRQEAEQKAHEAEELRTEVAGHARKADEIDPDVGNGGGRRARREDGERQPLHPDAAAGGVAGHRQQEGYNAGQDGRVDGTREPHIGGHDDDRAAGADGTDGVRESRATDRNSRDGV